MPRKLLRELDDSKNLAAEKRRELTAWIRETSMVTVAANSVSIIDARNIRNATLDAMRRAIMKLQIDSPVMIDGVDIPPGLPHNCSAIVKGDAKVPQIAAASIVAKTLRDGLMAKLGIRYPAYAWERNAGYGTRHHLSAIGLHGTTAHHRKSYAPIAQYCIDLELSAEMPDAMLETIGE